MANLWRKLMWLLFSGTWCTHTKNKQLRCLKNRVLEIAKYILELLKYIHHVKTCALTHVQVTLLSVEKNVVVQL